MVGTAKKTKSTTKRKTAKAKTSGGTTRTTSRSAKRRSPKQPEENPEVLEFERTQFLRAMDAYKRKTGKTFPSWTEVLDVLRGIGWMHPMKVQEQVDKAKAKFG